MTYEEIRQALRDADSFEEAEAAMSAADQWAAANRDDDRIIDLDMAVHLVAQTVEDNKGGEYPSKKKTLDRLNGGAR